MKRVIAEEISKLYVPPPDSHKGQNGRLLVIGGSHLFHAASLWALEVASRIVDLVHYSSVPENNEIIKNIKSEFRNGIVVSRNDVETYIEEDDCILIGPGMTRDGETKKLTDTLLSKYPQKQWVIDAGALQMMNISLIPPKSILTPHHQEFFQLYSKYINSNIKLTSNILDIKERVQNFSEKYNCIVLLKGQTDIVCSPVEYREIPGGNAGMTKGGTGDVLAGLIAALACKNDPFLAAIAGSFVNKKAGDGLYRKAGPYFNASDLADEIPRTMAGILKIT